MRVRKKPTGATTGTGGSWENATPSGGEGTVSKFVKHPFKETATTAAKWGVEATAWTLAGTAIARGAKLAGRAALPALPYAGAALGAYGVYRGAKYLYQRSHPQAAMQRRPSGMSVKQTGPRGGRFVTSKSGLKRYVGDR